MINFFAMNCTKKFISSNFTAVGQCALKSLNRKFGCSAVILHPRRSRGIREGLEEDVIFDNPGTVEVAKSKIPEKAVKELLEQSLSQDPARIDKSYPSDVELVKDLQQYKKWSRNQANHSYRPSEVSAGDTSIIFFPGQGSQFPGMAKKLLQFPNVKEMYEVANDVLRYDLLDLSLNGPKSELDKTLHCQPAVFVSSIAAIERLKEDNPRAIENCVGTAGFSVGEYAALVFAGVLSFEDGLRLVQIRARAMQAASEAVPSGMMTVFLGPANKINFACHTARQYCLKQLNMENPICHVANFLSTECKVVAGNVEALEFLKKHSKEFGITRCKSLPVSGAFHTKLMKPACKPVENALKELRLRSPLVPVYSNVTARQMSQAGKIKHLLVDQIVKPVKWEQIVHTIFTRPQGEEYPNVFEVGPGKQLGALLKLTNMKAYQNYRSIEV